MSKTHLFKKITILLTLFLFITVAGCSSKDEMMATEEETQDPGDDDPTDDGTSGDPVTGDPDLIIVDIQGNFLNLERQFSGTSKGLIRYRYMFGEYIQSVYSGATVSAWRNSYEVVEETYRLQKLNEQGSNTPNHLGLAEVLQAYTMMYLVDIFGDVPYSQAKDPNMFPEPILDTGLSVYDAQIALLDSAINNLSQNSQSVPEDMFFEGGFNRNNWIALANTLKLRAYLNLRLTNPARATQGINAVLNLNIIDTPEEDFQFRYGSSTFPDDRHPLFFSLYGPNGAGGAYMANGFYDFLNAGDSEPPFIETGIQDPRLRYYMYRQADRAPEGSNLPCTGDPDYDYCYVGNFYWGRDHGDTDGTPSDGVRRTTYGLYPIGGAFDRDLFIQARGVTEGLEGAGIEPIFLSSFTKFSLAEAALTLGTSGGNSQILLEQGIRLSMDKLINFAAGQQLDGFGITSTIIDDYVARVLEEYNIASANGKLRIIEREYYIASFGNAIEAYNMYRRTGFPVLQSAVTNAGPFPRVYLYPVVATGGNPNIQQQQVTNQTFWDNNPAGFID